MTKKQEVTKEAETLGVEVDEKDTIAEIEAKIAAHKETGQTQETFEDSDDAPFNEADGSKVNVGQEVDRGVLTTQSFEPVHAENDITDVDDDRKEEDVEVDEPEKEVSLAEAAPLKDKEILVKYVGSSATYQIGSMRFSNDAPFAVVTKEWADKVDLTDHSDLREARKAEAEEYYNKNFG